MLKHYRHDMKILETLKLFQLLIKKIFFKATRESRYFMVSSSVNSWFRDNDNLLPVTKDLWSKSS